MPQDPTVTAPEWCFRRAKKKIKAGHYDHDVDEKGAGGWPPQPLANLHRVPHPCRALCGKGGTRCRRREGATNLRSRVDFFRPSGADALFFRCSHGLRRGLQFCSPLRGWRAKKGRALIP